MYQMIAIEKKIYKTLGNKTMTRVEIVNAVYPRVNFKYRNDYYGAIDNMLAQGILVRSWRDDFPVFTRA